MDIKFKPRRSQRYEELRKQGFTKAESRTLSHIPENTPYLEDMKDARSKDFRRFKRSHQRMSPVALDKLWQNQIERTYRSKNWGNGRRATDIWQMLRENEHGEHKFKRHDREYKSPWVDKQKQFNSSISAIEKGLMQSN